MSSIGSRPVDVHGPVCVVDPCVGRIRDDDGSRVVRAVRASCVLSKLTTAIATLFSRDSDGVVRSGVVLTNDRLSLGVRRCGATGQRLAVSLRAYNGPSSGLPWVHGCIRWRLMPNLLFVRKIGPRVSAL